MGKRDFNEYKELVKDSLRRHTMNSAGDPHKEALVNLLDSDKFDSFYRDAFAEQNDPARILANLGVKSTDRSERIDLETVFAESAEIFLLSNNAFAGLLEDAVNLVLKYSSGTEINYELYEKTKKQIYRLQEAMHEDIGAS